MKMITEDILIECARRGAQLYAEQHPRPAQVTQVQAAQMLGLSAQTVGRMVREGRLPLNKLGYIPISEIDKALLVNQSRREIVHRRSNNALDHGAGDRRINTAIVGGGNKEDGADSMTESAITKLAQAIAELTRHIAFPARQTKYRED
jgi:hypothetical protein